AVFGLFLLVAASSAFVIGGVPLLGNSLDDLVVEALEYVRSLLKKHDPYTLPPMPDQHLVDTDVDFIISTHDVKVSNAGDFSIDKISNNLPLLKASFALSIPTAHISGNYKISGTGFQKKVQ
ncbi:JHBP domain-containing protein, partial [Shewanella sp. A25]|nr:JHBP domain-containing protein [Shewanella shenzhenensis]